LASFLILAFILLGVLANWLDLVGLGGFVGLWILVMDAFVWQKLLFDCENLHSVEKFVRDSNFGLGIT
jgi:hypothetical protein